MNIGIINWIDFMLPPHLIPHYDWQEMFFLMDKCINLADDINTWQFAPESVKLRMSKKLNSSQNLAIEKSCKSRV